MSFQPPLADSPYHALPLATLQSVILTTGPLIFFWSMLRQYISRSGPLPIFASITKYNSQLYAAFSATLAYLIYHSYFEPVQVYRLPCTLPILEKNTLMIETWVLGYVYHLSKLYEYVDIFNLVAQGIPINSHMAFHHISTPYLTYFRIISLPSASSGWPDGTANVSTGLLEMLSTDDWRVFALANCIHHTIMYAYFGHLGSWLRHIIPVTGWLQLALGIGTDGYWMYQIQGGKTLPGPEGEGREEATNRGIAMLLLARYATLYWTERTQITEAEKKGAVGRKEREEGERVKKRK